MAEKLHFNLVSPERQLMSAEVDHVTAPGAEGYFGVYPHHAPVMSTLSPGPVTVVNGSETRKIFVRGGFADVTPEGLTILAEEAVFIDELSAEDVAQRIRDAEEDVQDADTDDKRLHAERELMQLKELQAAM